MRSFKASVFGLGMAIAMLSAFTSGSESSLTVSGLDHAKFDTLINEKPVNL